MNKLFRNVSVETIASIYTSNQATSNTSNAPFAVLHKETRTNLFPTIVWATKPIKKMSVFGKQ